MVGKIQERRPSFQSPSSSTRQQKREEVDLNYKEKVKDQEKNPYQSLARTPSQKLFLNESVLKEMITELNQSPFCHVKKLNFQLVFNQNERDQVIQIAMYHVRDEADQISSKDFLQYLSAEALHDLWQQYTQFQSFELKGKLLNISC
jgi:hypothetical protein